MSQRKQRVELNIKPKIPFLISATVFCDLYLCLYMYSFVPFTVRRFVFGSVCEISYLLSSALGFFVICDLVWFRSEHFLRRPSTSHSKAFLNLDSAQAKHGFISVRSELTDYRHPDS